jgi:integrase
MAERLADKMVKAMEAPAIGNRITYDVDVKGFGVRITSAGARAFILNYRAGGRERRITIGSFPDWNTTAARDRAKELKREVDNGGDPMGERHERRAAPTVNALADRFVDEHLSKRRATTARDYGSILRLYIRPQLGTMQVADLRHSDVEKLHRLISKTAPYQANRTVAVLSKMLSLAVKWEMRTDNPARGIERAPEEKRERFLSPAEIARLADALAGYKEKVSATAIRFLLLTGARRGETLAARWSEFDLEAGVWVKPSAHTKTKKVHRVPLSAPSLVLLTELRAKVPAPCPFLFPTSLHPAKDAKGNATFIHLTDIKKAWAVVSKAAGLGAEVAKVTATGKPVLDVAGKPVLEWQPDTRLHDLRHTFASILANAGLSLPLIGRLLGHTQSATTQRYSHFFDDPLREATERVGAVVTGAGKAGADVVQLRKGA